MIVIGHTISRFSKRMRDKDRQFSAGIASAIVLAESLIELRAKGVIVAKRSRIVHRVELGNALSR